MIIDFKNLKEVQIKNFYGGNKEYKTQMFIDERNKIMHGRLVPGASIGLHTHETSSEIIYILSGKGHMFYDGEVEEVKEGLCHYCLKGHAHSLINDSDDDLIFFAVVPQQ